MIGVPIEGLGIIYGLLIPYTFDRNDTSIEKKFRDAPLKKVFQKEQIIK